MLQYLYTLGTRLKEPKSSDFPPALSDRLLLKDKGYLNDMIDKLDRLHNVVTMAVKYDVLGLNEYAKESMGKYLDMFQAALEQGEGEMAKIMKLTRRFFVAFYGEGDDSIFRPQARIFAMIVMKYVNTSAPVSIRESLGAEYPQFAWDVVEVYEVEKKVFLQSLEEPLSRDYPDVSKARRLIRQQRNASRKPAPIKDELYRAIWHHSSQA